MEDVKTVFADNWRSILVLELTDVRDGCTKRVIQTTQGRLYSTLRFGDVSLLEPESDDPDLPFGVDTLFDHLEKAKDYFLPVFEKKMKKPNLFIIPVDVLNSITTQKHSRAVHCLSSLGYVEQKTVSLKDCGIPNWREFNPMLEFRCVAIDSGASETVRDTLKECFWPRRDNSTKAKTVTSVFSRKKYSSVQHFSLERKHGLFVPSVSRGFDTIRTHSFKHQWFYRYRVHYPRLDEINPSLSKFLISTFENCPNHVFRNSGFSCSKCKTALSIELKHYTEHEVIDLAKWSREYDSVKDRHENLQKYFLDKDRRTIAVEVPLWAESNEFSDYEKVFKTSQALTGHIDLVRYIEERGGKCRVEIWDYKPGAYNEKYAGTQVLLYAFMLSLRTGIAFTNISCGYFDEVDAFTFKPGQVDTKILKELGKHVTK
ncbi:MAG: hypothetical protein IIB82_06930 [Bacteroidetes bacterium]|nr:hypothetical protein [Bacteroidota bacterium]